MAGRTRTLGELREDVLWQADRQGTSLRNEPARVNRAINQSIAEFREVVSDQGHPYYLQNSTGTLAPGATSPYHFGLMNLSGLTPLHLRIYGFDIQVQGEWRQLEPAHFRQRNDLQLAQFLTGIPEQFFQYDRDRIAYTPAPDAPYPYILWYLPVQTDLVADGDAFDGIAGWEEWVVFNAVAKLLLRDRDAHLERFQAERQRLLEGVVGRAGKRQRVGPLVRGSVDVSGFLRRRVASAAAAGAGALLAVFGASGVGHATGLVPDPGASAGTTRYLREDATWAAPPAATPGGATTQLQYNNAGAFAGTSGITTDGTYLAFGATVAASGFERFGAGASASALTLIAGLRADGGSTIPLFRWGAFGDNILAIGTTTDLASIYLRALSSMLFVVGTGTSVLSVTEPATSLTQSAATSGTAPVLLTLTGATHTGLTASTEARDVNIALARTVTMATGALTTQRAMRITAPTYAFAGASVVTRAATLAISGPPVAGTNATLTNTMALWLETGGLGFGSAPATAGALRLGNNFGQVIGYVAHDGTTMKSALAVAGDGSTFTDLLLGDSHATHGNNFLYLQAKTAVSWQLAGAEELNLSTTQLDLKGNNVVNVTQLTGAFFGNEIDDGNSSTADTIDWTTGPAHKSTLTGNCTYTFTAPAQHKWIQLKMIQDGTGGRTVTWPATVKWAGGTQPTWITTASAINIATFWWDGTNYLGVGSTGFA